MSILRHVIAETIEVRIPHPKIRDLVNTARREYFEVVKSRVNNARSCVALRVIDGVPKYERTLGRRFYLQGVMFDVRQELLDALSGNQLVRLPSINNTYVRLSRVRNKSGSVDKFISCLERCVVDGQHVEAYELKSTPEVMFMLNLFWGSESLDMGKLNRLMDENEAVTKPVVVDKTRPPPIVQSSEVVNKSIRSLNTTPPPIVQSSEVVNKSTSSLVTNSLLQFGDPSILDNLKYLPQIYVVLESIKALLIQSPEAVTPVVTQTVNTLTEVVHEIKDKRFESKIALTEGAARYLAVAFGKIEQLKANGESETKALEAVAAEGLREGSDLNRLMLEFQKSRGKRGRGYVTVYNLRDYYKNRFIIADGKVIKNPAGDTRDC